MATVVPTGLLGPAALHARIEDLKRTKGAPPWSEKIVVNDQIVGTLICQPPGHPTDRHYHLVDEWWFIVEARSTGRSRTMPRRSTRAPGTSSSRRRCTTITSVRPATGR